MSDTNTTAIAGLVKQIYDDYVERMQNLKHRAIDEIAKSAKKYNAGGQGFFGSINDYGNESGGAQNEEEQFRTIDSEDYVQYKVSPKVIAWPIQFSGLAAAVADSDEEAFANSVVDALDRAKERLLSDENRQFYGLGNGLLANPSASFTAAAISITVTSTQYLRRNMVIDSFAGSSKSIDSRRIMAVDRANNVIYFGTSLGVAVSTTDALVKENIRDSAPSDGKEMMGLRGIVDDSTDLTTFQNIDSTAVLEWRAIRIAAGGANLTSDLLQRLIDDVAILGGEEPDTLITHPNQRRKYLDIVVPQKRYMDGDMDSGFTRVEFNGKELWLDKDCQPDTVYGLKKSALRKFEVLPLQMGSHDGSDKFLRLSNFDVFQAYWRHYCNFGTGKRNLHGKIVNLAKPSGLS